jgi:hypothetical protein
MLTELIPARLFSKVIEQTLSEVASAVQDRHPDRADLVASINNPSSCEVGPGDWKWLINSAFRERIDHTRTNHACPTPTSRITWPPVVTIVVVFPGPLVGA